MKTIAIPFLTPATVADIGQQLDELKPHKLEHLLWETPMVAPQTSFVIAYNHDHFYLKFYVDEPHVQARHRAINDPVYLDSCVEFFMAFGDEALYYNLEFNCAGTCLGQFGTNKQSRTFLPPAVLQSIETHSQFGSGENADLIHWELTISIPKVVFTHHALAQLAPGSVRMNFYKCGDDLPERHYLAWSEPSSDEPNFHLPEYFGIGILEA
jgi:hypothetical protein